jgi:hypothetical protein
MARTELPVTWLSPNGVITDPAGVAADPGGHFISTETRTGVRDQVRTDDLTLRVKATAAGTVTIKAGQLPVAIASGQGDLVVAFSAAGSKTIGPFESARFLRNDGTILIDYITPASLTVAAIVNPRAV